LPGKHTSTPLGRLLAALPGNSEHLRRAWTTTIIVVAATAFVLSMIWVRDVSGSGPRPLMVQPAASTLPVYADPVPSPPVPIRSPSAAPSPAAHRATSTRAKTPLRPEKSAAPAVTARYRTGADWDRGFIAMLRVHNTSKTAQNWSITIRFDDRSGVRIGPVWNAVTSRNGDATVLRGSSPLAPGATLNVGFEATKRGRGQTRAPSCSINGSPCAMR
jgi:cellulase/cellobiase CelA1